MDNPWAAAWEGSDNLNVKQSEPSTSTWSPGAEQEADIGLPSWSATTTSQWTATSVPAGTIWPAVHSDANAWGSSPAYDHPLQHEEETSEQDITAHDEQHPSQQSTFSPATKATPPVPDYQLTSSSPPIRDSHDLVAETFDGTSTSSEPVSRVPEPEENPDAWADPTTLAPADSDWGVAWTASPSAESNQQETRPPDEWETARQEKEKLNRAVPPQLLESIIRHSQQVSEEIWPPLGTPSGDSWRRAGLDDLQDITRLLAQLLPDDGLPLPVQFSETAAAKAMNEALKLTRHMPLSARSPLSRLLASRGSLEWERSVRSTQDTVPDAAPVGVGWRVLEKEDRVSSTEDSKPKTAASSLLSFWNRRVSAVVAAPTEVAKELSMSTRSSLDGVKPDSPPNTSRSASPSRVPTSPAQAPSLADAKIAVAAPSAVSRFFNRFSRTKSSQHSSLALSSNDLEFLSDIVPSASDPDDEQGDDTGLEAFPSVTKSSPLPPKLPPPLPPPPKPSTTQSRPPSSVGLGILHGGNLTPPMSPQPPSSFARAQSPVNISRPAMSSMTQNLSISSPPNSRPQSPFTLPPPPRVPSSLSIPPLLPPPPVSPPQTPRPSVVPTMTLPRTSSTARITSAPAFYDAHDGDDEFSAFSSFPPAPFPSVDSYPQQPPSPPSPPPRRTYERTHHPSTSSTSSAQSPSSQNSGDRLRSARSSISVPFDRFDDFVSPSNSRSEGRKRTPSPPPIPAKPQARAQRQQLNRIDTFPSHVYHTHTLSQTFASPTVHTGLMSSAFSPTTVSDAEHQRTRHLVDHAAAHGGLLWPNSPESPPQPKMRSIPPPPLSMSSPKSLIGDDSVDLLGDGDLIGSTQPTLPPPLGSSLGSSAVPTRSSVTSPVMSATRVPSGVAMSVSGKNPFPLSSPPLAPSLLSFSSFGSPVVAPVAKAGSSQPAKPSQTGGLSAQDLSFFEGL